MSSTSADTSAPFHGGVNPSDDSSSPYYLHPSESTGALLISEIFTGENYLAWSRAITIALTVKNKLAFIDGTILPPSLSDTVMFTAWLRANNLVLSWLMNTLAKDIRNSYLYVTSAFDLWNELKSRFLHSDGPRVFQLEKALSSITQGSASLTEFFGQFKCLWDEYTHYRALPNCSCGALTTCTCNLFQLLISRQQSDCVLKFLVGLNDSYASVRSQILMTHPLPSMADVFSILIQEESQRALTNSGFPAPQIFMTKNTNSSGFKERKKRSHLLCSHCGFTGHTVEKCFQIHGYPEGWTGPKGKRFNTSTAPPSMNTAITPIQPVDASGAIGNTDSRCTLTSDDITKLLALVHNQPSSSSSSVPTSTPHAVHNALNTSGSIDFEDDWDCL